MYSDFCARKLQELKQENLYREFLSLVKSSAKFPSAMIDQSHKEVTLYCSNDYLGLSRHPKVIKVMQSVLSEQGAGSGGTRNIAGTNMYHVKLENKLAAMHKKDAALLFSSGYVANEGAISALASSFPDCVVLSDQENHASIIHGIRYSKAEKLIFQHNDLNHLEQLLQSVDINRFKIIVFESIYSISGSIAPVKQICQLAKKYNAMTYIDEVHSVGLYGDSAGGLVEALGLESQIDVICANFGKAFGLFGGYIAANSTIVNFIRSFAPQFIFTTSLPPAVAAGALESVANNTKELRTKMHNNVRLLQHKLTEQKIAFTGYGSHITTIKAKNQSKAISARLLNDYGIYIQPINYPTVPKNEERLRITLTPYHSIKMIDYLVDSLRDCLKFKKIV